MTVLNRRFYRRELMRIYRVVSSVLLLLNVHFHLLLRSLFRPRFIDEFSCDICEHLLLHNPLFLLVLISML